MKVKVGDRLKSKSIGRYDDEEQAAREYNAYVISNGLSAKLNPVDANGKLVPKKMTSRFWGVYWYKSSSKWRAEYFDDSEPRRKCHVGYFVDEFHWIQSKSIEFVHKGDDGQFSHATHLKKLEGSGFNSFGVIDEHDRRIYSREHSVGIFRKVGVSWCIQEV